MARYIDADKTLDMMWNALYQYEDELEKKHGLNLIEMLDVQNGFEVAHKVVVDAPAEDVAPVIHSRWFPYSKQMLICDNCVHYWIAKGDQYDFKYCPNCGAKMNEEEK